MATAGSGTWKLYPNQVTLARVLVRRRIGRCSHVKPVSICRIGNQESLTPSFLSTLTSDRLGRHGCPPLRLFRSESKLHLSSRNRCTSTSLDHGMTKHEPRPA